MFMSLRIFNCSLGFRPWFQTFSGHDGAVMAVQTSGEKIYTATTDGVIRAFKIDWEFVKQYLQVLSGEVVEDDLGDDFKPEEDDDDDEDIESGTVVQGIVTISMSRFSHRYLPFTNKWICQILEFRRGNLNILSEKLYFLP